MRDILQELRELERRAGAIHDLFAGAAAQAPGRTEGTDRTGTVRVVLDGDGLPAAITVAEGWQDVLAESEFGRAVRDAFTAAIRSRMALWSQAVAASGPRDRTGDPPPDVPVVPPRRPFAEVLEDVLRAGEQVATAPVPAGVGRDESGRLVLTLAPSGLVSCEAPAHWLAFQPAEALNLALAQAVRAARASLATARGATAPQRPSQLLAEVLGHLAGFPQPSEPGRARP